MDPPTTSSSSGIKNPLDVLSTPKAKDANQSRSSARSNFSPTNTYFATRTSPRPLRSSTLPIHRSRNIAKIIKGEIHNVLTVMRSDPRYYTTGGDGGKSDIKRGNSRFEYEERHEAAGTSRFWSNSGSSTGFSSYRGMMKRLDSASNTNWSTAAGSIAAHPVLQGLRDLYDLLSSFESDFLEINDDGDAKFTLNSVSFVSPFAAAVLSPDVDAKTTGAALSALHKFIVYGFIGGHNDVHWSSGNYYSDAILGLPSSSDVIQESITVVAQCIRQCSFEGAASKNSTGGSKRMLSFWSSDKNQKTGLFMLNPPETCSGDHAETQATAHDLPQFLLQPRRQRSSSSNSTTKSTSISDEDENVVLKLLSLSVQVLRCPAGKSLLSPSDIVGIFDTCMFVCLVAGEAKRSLLRSAAADALSHCVIVVCGMRPGGTPQHHSGKHALPSLRRESGRDDDTGEPTTEGASDSDDDWGERDPTIDVSGFSFLANRSEMTEPSQIANEKTITRNTCEPHERFPIDAVECEEPALVAIMARLAAIADPLIQQDDTCVLSLSLINIALETMNDVDTLASKHPRLLSVMQNDLCRNLLRLSTSSDLTLLGLALRVIFNLFNGIKHHMKLQLEIFLLSVHLRMLSSSTSPTTHQQVWSSSPERRELALESLLEFCREPMLMMDVYLNYDCDINCSNLFETICITLAKVANPDDGQIEESNTDRDESKDDRVEVLADDSKKPRLNILNRLALEGIIAVIDSIARRCRVSANFPISPSSIVGSLPKASLIEDASAPSPPDSGNSASLGDTLCMRRDFHYDTRDYDFCSLSSSSDSFIPEYRTGYASVRTNSDMSEINLEEISKTEYHLALRERKIRKRRLAKAAAAFNDSMRDKDWIAELERLMVLPSPPTPKSVASFLHSASKLDKTKIGEYISKGPKEKYPFIEKVLEEFTKLFDFSGMSFSGSLRLFLSTFRLPGEAQCIDRLMEAFARRLYEAQIASNPDENAEKAMLDPPRVGSESDSTSRCGLIDPPTSDEARELRLPFRSADAAFILAFSTIMLNTDLHNPNMNDEKRMTLEQFIRNNRGINDGADLPREFLQDLYFEIKNNEIQVKAETIHSGYANVGDFDGLLKKANDTIAPFFTSSQSVRNKFIQAGMHERDMFIAISSATTRAISTVFVQSWDDALVTKALAGLRSSANICAYFGLNEEFNDILELLFSWGHDYIASVAKLSHSELDMVNVGGQKLSTESCKNERLDFAALDADLVSRDLPPLPAAIVATLDSENSRDRSHQLGINIVSGSAAHRGLLSLNCALLLVKSHLCLVNEALPTLLEVLFALRDLDALPPRLSDLDDFADSKGNPLAASTYAIDSLARVNEYRMSLSSSTQSCSNPRFLSMFSFERSSQRNSRSYNANMTPKSENPLIQVLRAVSEKASLDQIIMKMNDVNMAKRILSSMLSAMLPEDVGSVLELSSDPLYQDNAVFVLELAARLLISNRAHSAELLPIFLTKFEALFSLRQEGYTDTSILGLKIPYLLERIIITILRAVIHLYDINDRGLRMHLVRSLELISKLPLSYTQEISDRLGCGAAIILRGCFFLFESREEWSAITNLLDIAAQHHSGRPFVFDSIASLVDYALPMVVNEAPADTKSDVNLSNDGAEALRSLLLKFLEGSYNDDLSYKVPSIMYMRRLYSMTHCGSTHFHPESVGSIDSLESGSRQQGFEWIKMVSIIYEDVCLSHDLKTSKKGFESLREVLLSTKVEAIFDDHLLAFMQIVCANPPKITVQASRISLLNLIADLFLSLVPALSNRNENWAQLEEFTFEVAKMVGENLRSGRATPLFETTVHVVTNVCNIMSMDALNNGQGINFCSWVGETLSSELEKVGACGGLASFTATYGSRSS